MHVVNLKAENFKRLVAVDITPDPIDPAVVISGKNAQGKSSVLDAIWAALGGAKVSPEKPVREGAKEAKVTLDLGELKVTRTWKGGRSHLTVENAAGGALPSPQAVLDTLVGKLAFDPLAFALADEKTQRATLLDVVDLPFDPDIIASQRRLLYDRRTEVNREVKRFEGALGAAPAVPGDTPDEEVSASTLVEYRDVLKRLQAQMLDATGRWTAIEAEIAEHEAAIVRLRAEQDEVTKAGTEAAQRIGDVPIEAQIAHVEAQLSQVDEINAAVRAKQMRQTIEADLARVQADSADLTRQIEELDAKKAAGLAAAAMPVPGLGFDDDGVTLNGVPFSQASAAERLRTSTAIAMAKNPQVKVILIRDGSLLDSDNLRIITDLAAERGFQVWIEKVDESGSVGVVIEEGSVVT